MDYGQTYTSILLGVYYWEVEKKFNVFNFDDIDLIFKVTGSLTMLNNGLFVPYFLTE